MSLIVFDSSVFRADEIVGINFSEAGKPGDTWDIEIFVRGFDAIEFSYEYQDQSTAERKYKQLIQDWKAAMR